MIILSDQKKLVALYDDKTKAKAKLAELYKKLEEAAEKYRFRLSHFRGVAHESASGELASSELKVREDFVHSLRAEILQLEKKLGVPTKIPPRFP
jgi:hypothetical protein